MKELMTNPAFKAYALSTAVLVLNLLVLGGITAARRGKNKAFSNPEDAPGFVEQAADHPKVARAVRAHRNAMESILPFFGIGLVYVLLGATPRGALIYFSTFTVARLLHSVVYLLEKQPWRTITFVIGALCLIGMSIQVIMLAMKMAV